MILYNDTVRLIEDSGSGEYDDYNRPLQTERIVTAHVRYKLKTVYGRDGEKVDSVAQVYIPFDEGINPITYAPRVELFTPAGVTQLGKAVRTTYGQDVAGNPHFVKLYL